MRASRLEDWPNQGQTVAVSNAAKYEVPVDGLGLKGPIARPEPGTLPLRGDLAHIALAGQFLVPHYVIPQIHEVGAGGADLKLSEDAASDTLTQLAAGASFEVLDLAGDWYWGCVGPEGPSGYVPKDSLIPQSA
jgi:hypothetical protein